MQGYKAARALSPGRECMHMNPDEQAYRATSIGSGQSRRANHGPVQARPPGKIPLRSRSSEKVLDIPVRWMDLDTPLPSCILICHHERIFFGNRGLVTAGSVAPRPADRK